MPSEPAAQNAQRPRGTGPDAPGTAGRVDVRVLGPAQVEVEGDLVHVRGTRRQALLTVLALSPGEVVSRDRLVDQIWGDEAPATAATSLRVHISQLRRDLGDELLRTADGGYRLEVSDEAVDVTRFRRAAVRGRELLAQRRFSAAREAMEAAATEWHDPVLPAAQEVVALRPVVEQLERLRDEMELHLAEARLRSDGTTPDVAAHEDLVRRRPYDERAWELLMTALYWAGRQSDALAAYQRARQALADEMGLDPGPRLVELEVAILNQDASIAPPQNPSLDLPEFATSFVGRHAEVPELAKLVADNRLITITGLGGAGKTRLAAEAARAAAGDFPDGVVFASLERLVEGEFVVQQLAEVLNAPGSECEAIAAEIGERRLLLLLDNAEHLLETVAETIRQLLTRCRNLVVLVTSRLRLGMQTEVVWPIPLLEVPSDDVDSAEELATFDSVRLFLERGATAWRGLRLDRTSASGIAEICRLTTGIPLAIELAAARCDVLSVTDIVQRLRRNGTELTGGERDRPERQHTIDAAVQWTLDLLGPAETALFRRLAAFSDPFGPSALEEVCVLPPLTTSNLLDAVDALRAASLLQADPSGDQAKYWLLEPVRRASTQLLAASDEARELEDRHLVYARRLVAEAGQAAGGPDEAHALDRLDAVVNDVRTALQHAYDTDRPALVEMCVQLGQYWTRRRLHVEARRWIDRALEAADEVDVATRAKLLDTAGWLALDDRGDLHWARRHTDAALALREELADPAGLAGSTMLRGAVVSHAGDHAEAYRDFSRALSLLRELNDDHGVSRASYNSGVAAQKLGRLDDAGRHLGEALESARRSGHRWMEAMVLERQAYIATARGDLSAVLGLTQAAHEIHEDSGGPVDLCRSHWSLAICYRSLGDVERTLSHVLDAVHLAREQRFSDTWWMPGLLETAAAVVLDRGDPVLAARLLGAAEALRDREGLGASQQTVHDLDEVVTSLRHELGDDRYLAERTAGTAHSGQAALRLITGALDTQQR